MNFLKINCRSKGSFIDLEYLHSYLLVYIIKIVTSKIHCDTFYIYHYQWRLGWHFLNHVLSVSCYKSDANTKCSTLFQLLSAWLSVLLCGSEENLAFTALSSQHAMPQDLGSGQVSLFSLCTATRLGSNSICKIRKKNYKVKL